MEHIEHYTTILAPADSHGYGLVLSHRVMLTDRELDLPFHIFHEMLLAQMHTGISLVYNGIMLTFIAFDTHRSIPASKKASYYLFLW